MTRLNIQGLARRDSLLMKCLITEPERTFVSVDLTSGEPTCTAHYSQDANYIAASFGMIGKDPYYKDGILMIDDIYLMAASVSPLAEIALKECFDKGDFDDWNNGQKEYIQKAHPIIAPLRAFHKPLVLGLGYAMGPRKMVTTAADNGKVLLAKDSKAFWKAYWQRLFTGLASYAKKQQAILGRQGYLVNQFGYRLTPDSPHKAFNYMIQSTVSGIINLLDALFEMECSKLDVEFVTIIHDELIYDIADEDLKKAKKAMDKAVKELNKILGWTVNVRVGFVTGKNMYEAK